MHSTFRWHKMKSFVTNVHIWCTFSNTCCDCHVVYKLGVFLLALHAKDSIVLLYSKTQENGFSSAFLSMCFILVCTIIVRFYHWFSPAASIKINLRLIHNICDNSSFCYGWIHPISNVLLVLSRCTNSKINMQITQIA